MRGRVITHEADRIEVRALRAPFLAMTSRQQGHTRPVQILLVEDNAMDAELTLDAFHRARLTNSVHVARTGQEALDYVTGRADFADRQQHPLPDLILLDLKLPQVSGHEVLREIKSLPRLKRIPVVILTSSKEEGDRALSYDLGANSYLVKPVRLDDFLAMAAQIKDYWLTLNVKPSLEATALDELSARERQVLQLLVEGKPSIVIAQELFLSPKTVETYRSRIMQKLDIHNIPDLVKFAIKKGLTSI
jgi:DNA-binding NarL/FixJ family response regulator